jgi:MFS family permease
VLKSGAQQAQVDWHPPTDEPSLGPLEDEYTQVLYARLLAVAGRAAAVGTGLVGREQRGRAIGLVHTAGDLGSAAGPPVAYALLAGIGLSGVYALCAGLFVMGWMLVLMQRTRKGALHLPQHMGGNR